MVGKMRPGNGEDSISAAPSRVHQGSSGMTMSSSVFLAERPVTLTKDFPHRELIPKVRNPAADSVRMTVNSTSRTSTSHANQVNQASQQAARHQVQNKAQASAQDQSQTQRASSLQRDTVTLSRARQKDAAPAKSSGDADHGGDKH
jgi:hypothetical protein